MIQPPKRTPRLCDIPADQYPMHYDRYHRLYDELDAAADGFAELMYSGVPAAAGLYDQASAIRASLVRLWSDVQSAERAERAEEASV